jgi:hypothetical protein
MSYPLHGNGFQAQWRVQDVRRERVDLILDSDGPGPFRYQAQLRYWLAEGALGMRLAVVHRGAESLPYGLGFHPSLVRDELTVLQAAAEQVWLEDARHLPAGRLAIRERAAWDFARPQRLPREWINNAFVGWDGRATVTWPSRGLTLAIDASQADGLTSSSPPTSCMRLAKAPHSSVSSRYRIQSTHTTCPDLLLRTGSLCSARSNLQLCNSASCRVGRDGGGQRLPWERRDDLFGEIEQPADGGCPLPLRAPTCA